MIVEFLKEEGVKEKEVVIAGNTVEMDEPFIDIYMPLLSNYIHHKAVNYTSILEQFQKE